MRTLIQQALAVAQRTVSPTELVERTLQQAQAVEPLNALTHVLADDALARARELEEIEPRGALHGVPVAVKELFDVEGVPTTGCCAAYANRVASSDAAVVAKLRSAGAIVVAKTNQHELACGATNLISSFGPCLNPWDTTRIAGGSSGGSGVAVAAGVFAMAMGSDTGGSIRAPASFCGVTGLKPTHGAVSLRGAMPMCPTLDTAGPLAVTAEDCALVHRLINGFDPNYEGTRHSVCLGPSPSLEGLRVAVPAAFLRVVHSDTKSALYEASRVFESLGAVCMETEAGPDPEDALRAFSMLGIPQVANCYRDLWDDERVGAEIAAIIALGRQRTALDVCEGLELAQKVRRDFEKCFKLFDVLLAPSTAFPAPRVTSHEVKLEGGTLGVHSGGPARLTVAANIAGLPSLALPIGFSRQGMPLGAQVIGKPWSELHLCSIGVAYQNETDFHLQIARQPPMN